MSYYAVREGRQPGVYRTWADCQAQVSKHSGAVFKKFDTQAEAEEFVNPSGAAGIGGSVRGEGEDSVPSFSRYLAGDDAIEEIVDVYTDGSHHSRQGYDYVGSGAYCLHNGFEYRKSFACNAALLQLYGIEGNTKVSNPTSEFLAFAETLYHFWRQPLRPHLLVRFWIDYVGVGNFMSGAYQAKEVYIQKILKSCRTMLDEIACHIEIHYVAGHSKNPGNDAADLCAKDCTEYDNFGELVGTLLYVGG